MPPTDQVLLTRDEGAVRLLTLNRPAVRNAFNDDLYDSVRHALRNAAVDQEVAAVVITGQGDVFSAGQDLRELRHRSHREASERGFIPFIRAVAAFEKPLLAAVNGPAVGVGFTMLLHCDLVFVSDSTRFRAPFVPLGLAPEAASSLLLPARVGTQTAALILFAGEWIDAHGAVTAGLACRACPPERVLDETMGVALNLATHPLTSLQATKRLLLAARSDAVTAAMDREDAETGALLRSRESSSVR